MKSFSFWKNRVLQRPRLALSCSDIVRRLGLAWVAMTVTFSVTASGNVDSPTWISFEESEGYLDGSAVETFTGWSVSQEASGGITKDECFFGEQSLRIESDLSPIWAEYWAENISHEGVRFIQASIKPAPVEGGEAMAFLNLWGAEIELTREGDEKVHLHFSDIGSGNESSESVSFPVHRIAGEQSEPWLDIVIRQDLEAATWDLFLNGELVAVDLGLGEYRESMEIELGPQDAIYLDGIGVGTENPLFADSDGDGMPDAYEIAHGLNPHLNDRNGDKDGDGISNILEYQAGTSPNAAETGLAAQVIYVDNSVGRDSNSGRVSTGGGSNGPMFSIKAAMASAQNGAVIVVLPGTGVYNEGSRSAKGKRITIRTVKPIVIK